MTAHIEPRPHQATCVICMKRKQCITKRILRSGELRQYDNFTYSEEHRGWICRKCRISLEKTGGTTEVPDILRKP